MHVRRGYLFAGLFLIPVGAITLLVRAGSIEASSLDEAWRLWPLILVGFGIAILLGRSGAASVGTAVSALVVGVLVGSAIASGNFWIGGITDCGPGPDTQQLSRTGTFTATAGLDLRLRCGSVALSMQAGNDWSVAATYRGPAPLISEAGDGLGVRVPEGAGVRHGDWTITAPTGRLGSVRLTADAATATFNLQGATLTTLNVEANAGDVLVDGGAANIGEVDVSMNAGRVRLTLGRSTTLGSISVNAGAIDLCVPADASLRFDVDDQLTFVTNLAHRGLQQSGRTWTRTGSGGALIDLHVEGNAASFNLDPDGGCR